MRAILVKTLGQAKRLIITIVGFTILAAGIAMLVLPGPAIVVIPVGLAVLATEFLWARRLLATVRGRLESWRNGTGKNGGQRTPHS